MTQFINRAYNFLEVDSDTNAIIYKRSKELRLADEADYYLNLPKELSVYFPRIFSYNSTNQLIELGLEYYAYNNLGNLMIHHQFDEEVWKKIFLFLMNFSSRASTYSTRVNGANDCELMYINKTEREYHKLLLQFPYFLNEIERYDYIYLNGKKLLTFHSMWPTFRKHIQSRYLVSHLTYIHGDLCFSNILYGQHPINGDVVLKFVDPRGSFGSTKSYGDFYYDLAKIMHSCDGRYEYFITDNFKVTHLDQQRFELAFTGTSSDPIAEMWRNLLRQHNFDITKVETLQGLIFIGMCARHYDSFERQKGMYLTGLRILNTVYENLF